MSQIAKLKAATREDAGKGVARKLRQSGHIPAVVYGDGADALPLTLNAHDTLILFQSISVENTIVSLDLDKGGAVDTLVREVQVHPYRNDIMHVDFLRIRKGTAIDVNVPVHLLGVPEGVKLEGGILEQIVHDLSVRCIPSKIPESIEVDISGLAIGDSLHVSDLPVEEGVEIAADGGLTICLVSAPRVVEEVVTAEGEEGLTAEGDAAAPDGAADESAGDEG
jgi:large subunit ribosomal protein L25